MEDFFQTKSYQSFLKNLKSLDESKLLTSPDNLQQKRVEVYWTQGKEIARFSKKVPHGQKQTYYQRVAADIEHKSSHIFLLQNLYDAFPRGLPKFKGAENLSWSQYTVIIPIENKNERDFYLKMAAEEEISRDRLRKAVKTKLYEKLQETLSEKHPHGILKRPEDPTYLFIASSEDIHNPDADTLDALLDQGFRSWHRDTFRLRGINSPEIHGPDHEIALAGKLFVAEELTNAALILIKSYKTDKYGRYIADVIYHPVWTDPVKVFRQGIFLNQILLDRGFAKLAVY
ncbi:MAG: thermonuclease family protein [Deltaproteobacteria bacterium]|nr:thermonuclease family protein [Deltaproteobacteria bacterium]